MTDSRKRAAHVEKALRATAKTVQSKPAGGSPPAAPARQPAAHVQAAMAAVQPRLGNPSPSVRPLAAHVQAAVGKGLQLKADRGNRAPAAHVQPAAPRALRVPGTPPSAVVQRATRSRGASWGSVEAAFKEAFRSHAAEVAPVSDDDKHDDDTLAEMIVSPTDQNCAAIYRYQRGEPPHERYIIAYATNTNQPAPTNRDLQQTSEDMWSFFDFERIDNDERIHCELVIVSRFGTDVSYIGITKRCCRLCTMALRAIGFDVAHRTRGCHGAVYSTGWKMPSWLLGEAGLLRAFMGAEAYEIYQSMGQSAQQNAIAWIQSGLSSI